MYEKEKHEQPLRGRVIFMKCPFCGEEMSQGKLRTRGENYFIPDGCNPPLLYTNKSMEKAGAVLVSPDAFSAVYEANWQAAWKCDNCRKVIIDY